MCVANSDLINIPCLCKTQECEGLGAAVTADQGTATRHNYSSAVLQNRQSYSSAAQQLPDRAIAQQHYSYQTQL